MGKSYLKIISGNSNTRALVKTIAWRIIATVITGIIVYLYTGKFEETGKIALTIAIVLTVLYFVHEKMWQRIK